VAKIKSALEIAMEKSKKIEKLSSQEMNEIRQQEKIDRILAKYYKDEIEADDLWRHLKDISNKMLINAQNNFLQSLTFQSNEFEIEKRKNGILAIENLKNDNLTSDIEFSFEQLAKIRTEFKKNKEQLMQILREELERDPQRRFQTFQQDGQIVVKQLSMEEAMEQDEQLKKNLKQLEMQFSKKYNTVKEKISNIINN
jgi:serine/threonine protein kinase